MSEKLPKTIRIGHDLTNFNEWWWHLGSGMRPEHGEDGEEHVRRVSEYVWEFAHRQGQRKAQDRIRRLEDYIRRYRYNPSLPDRDLENARQKFIDKLLEEFK